MPQQIKIIVERHDDGYVAYPIGLKGVVVAQGDTYAEALENVRSAIAFHVETFGSEMLEDAATTREVFVAETEVILAA